MLTALLAVLALVFGVLTMAAPATAKDKPDTPGNSATAPGHDDEFVPPGQVDDGTPGNSDGTPGGGNGTDTAKKIWICHADVNHNGDAGLGDGKGGEFQLGYNLIYISVNAAENAHFKLHPMDVPAAMTTGSPVCPAPVTQYFCPDNTDKKGTELTSAYVPGEVPDRCNTDDPSDGVFGTALYTETLCMYTVLTSGVQIGTPYTTPVKYATQTEANTVAAAYWTAEAKAAALATFLADPANTAYTMPTMTDTGLVCITPEQAAAIDAALAEPATVAPVLPGTIEEPEVVAVPAPATVPPLPATIPAGDGSGTPTVPTALLALLVLGATALAASTVRLVRTTR